MYVGKNRTQRTWTAEDDATFKRIYGKISNRKVAEIFGVTENCVKNRAYQLKCNASRSPQNHDEMQTFLRRAPVIAPPLGPMEFAPGHQAFDQESYDLLKRAGAIR